MMDKSDWEVVRRRLIEDGRERAGDPPTAEEVEALFNGELPDEAAERVRNLLVYYPEMARVMMAEPPAPETTILTDEERAKDWAAIQRRIHPAIPIRRRRPSRVYAYAAALLLALLLGAIAYYESRLQQPVHLQIAQRVHRSQLRPDALIRGSGSAAPIVLPVADDYVLDLLTSHTTHYGEYRIEMIDVDTGQKRSLRTGLPESPSGVYEFSARNAVLKPGGHYRFILYGASSGKLERLATYTVRISKT